MVGGRYRVEENKREKKWDNCNSIINKIYFKKYEDSSCIGGFFGEGKRGT